MFHLAAIPSVPLSIITISNVPSQPTARREEMFSNYRPLIFNQRLAVVGPEFSGMSDS